MEPVQSSAPETWQTHLANYQRPDLELFSGEFLTKWGAKKWSPGEADKRAAHHLHVQLTSRVATQPLPNLEGVEPA